MYLKSWELVHWRPKGESPIASIAVEIKLECPVCHRQKEFTSEGDALGPDAMGAIRWIMTVLGVEKEVCSYCGVASLMPNEDRERLEREANARITDEWLTREREKLAPSPFAAL